MMEELISKTKDILEKKPLEDFNVFTMLQIETDEVKLHSRFLSYLFNRTSPHGCKDLFLNLFLDMIGKERNPYTVFPELILGNLGRADVTFRNENSIIILENKVWSGLGYRQLERYSEYLNKQKQGKKLLVFLSPKKQEIENNIDGVEIIGITYGDISKILTKSLSDISNPSFSEVLKQYIKICNKISGENMEEYSHKEIIEVLRKKDAFNVYKSIWQAGVEESIECLIDFYNKILQKAPGSFLSRTERWGGPINLSIEEIKSSVKNYPEERFQGVNIPIGKYKEGDDLYEYYIKIELNGRIYYVIAEYINGKRSPKISKMGEKLKSTIHFKHDWVYPSKTLNWKNLVDPRTIPDKHASLDIGYDFFDEKIRNSLIDHMLEEIDVYRSVISKHLQSEVLIS